MGSLDGPRERAVDELVCFCLAKQFIDESCECREAVLPDIPYCTLDRSKAHNIFRRGEPLGFKKSKLFVEAKHPFEDHVGAYGERWRARSGELGVPGGVRRANHPF